MSKQSRTVIEPARSHPTTKRIAKTARVEARTTAEKNALYQEAAARRFKSA